MIQYLHSDADGVEFYYDVTSRDIIVRDSRTTDDPVRECKIPWSILKSRLHELGHD